MGLSEMSTFKDRVVGICAALYDYYLELSM